MDQYDNTDIALKVHTPIFQKLWFSVSFEESSLQRCKSKISVETVKPFGCMKEFSILQLPISYFVSIFMVTKTRHIFINIFHREHLSALKFPMRY